MKFPGYFKYAMLLLAAILTFYALIAAKGLLIPLSLAMVFALLLYPLSKRMEWLLIPRSLAAGLCIILLLTSLFAIGFMLGIQLDSIRQELPGISERIDEKLGVIQAYLERTFGIDRQDQSTYIRETVANFFQDNEAIFKTTFKLTAGLLNYLVVVPIGLFFMLYYRSFFKEFMFRLTPRQQHDRMERVLEQIQRVMQEYILGLFTVIFIVAVLNTVGLYIVGIRYAIFFGLLGALLTVIPYIGIFIGSLLPILYALFTTDSLAYPLGVAFVFWFVQVLEGNFITPNVVGNRVQLNPFAAILSLLVGGAVWGPAGMILFIPFLAMLKVLFDAIEPLQPWGFLLGNPPEVKNEGKTYRELRVRTNTFFKRLFR
jgi:predicted PurR-regulated permease PerM